MTVSAAEPLRSRLFIDSDFHRRYVSDYFVESDDIHEAPSTVANATGIPTFRTPYVWPPPPKPQKGADAWAFAATADAFLRNAEQSRLIWTVRVVHETTRPETGRRPNASERQDPLSEPPMWGGSMLAINAQVLRDRNDALLTLSNEMPIRDQVKEVFYDTLTLSFNTATISLSQRNGAVGSLNNGAFWGFAANVIRITQWQYVINYYGPTDTPYVNHQFEFQFDEANKWQTKIHSRDVVELLDTAETDPQAKWRPIQIKDAGGRLVQVTRPVPLDSLGRASAAQDFLGFEETWDLEDELDFTTLPIPGALPNPPFV